MEQSERSYEERRRDPRRPMAFSFWFRPTASTEHSSAWMLNTSAGGAAFLTVAGDAPDVGERLELTEMYSANRLVREKTPQLPSYARVVRVDDTHGATRRVAVQFESDIESQVVTKEKVAGYQWAPPCPEQKLPPPMPQTEQGQFASQAAIFY